MKTLKFSLTFLSIPGWFYRLHLEGVRIDATVDVHDVGAKLGLNVLSVEARLEGVVGEVTHHPGDFICGN